MSCRHARFYSVCDPYTKPIQRFKFKLKRGVDDTFNATCYTHMLYTCCVHWVTIAIPKASTFHCSIAFTPAKGEIFLFEGEGNTYPQRICVTI